MSQISFADAEYAGKREKARRDSGLVHTVTMTAGNEADVIPGSSP